MTREDRAGPWSSGEYVDAWRTADALVEATALPRRIAAALIVDSGIEVGRVVDLGAGEGGFLRELLEALPDARGTWVDASAPMRERAGSVLEPFAGRVDFATLDLRETDQLPLSDADVIVSARALHHFEVRAIRNIYAAAFDALRPGGFLVNLDHFGPPADWEAAYRRVRPAFVPPRGTTRPHPHDAPPQPLEDHLAWLTEAGFAGPDVPWRFFWTALVVVRKPEEQGPGPAERA
jgi:SAM-dependent methyltransferase